MIVFHRAVDSFSKHEAVKVIAKADDHLLVERTNGSRASLFPATGKSFDVGLSGELELLAGERLLIRANCAEAKVRNGDIVEVAGWDESGVIRLERRATATSLFPPVQLWLCQHLPCGSG